MFIFITGMNENFFHKFYILLLKIIFRLLLSCNLPLILIASNIFLKNGIRRH
jgi:hypothetical protein